MKPEFEMWAKLEQMGFKTRWGFITEVEAFGGKIGRIDIYTSETEFTREFFGAASVYNITPSTREECIERSQVVTWRVVGLRPAADFQTMNNPPLLPTTAAVAGYLCEHCKQSNLFVNGCCSNCGQSVIPF